MRWTVTAALAAALGSGACCSDYPIRQAASVMGAPQVFDGRPADSDEIRATVAVDDRCTGTLVAPTVVLTAAHCLFTNLGAPSPVETVYAGGLDYRDGTPYRVQDQVAHQDYDRFMTGELGSFNDVGLLILAEPVASLEVAPILGLLQLDGAVEAGTMVTISGYGTTGEDIDNTVLYVAETPFLERGDTEFSAGGAGHPDACSGDSGGPVYFITDDGAWYVMGVTSRALGTPTSACEDAGGIYTLAGAYEDFLQSAAAGAYPSSDTVGSADDGCSSSRGVGSPSSGRPWLFFVLMIGFRHLRLGRRLSREVRGGSLCAVRRRRCL